jgi:two-component system response regulator
MVNEIEILLVEDTPEDRELTIRALRKNNLANRIHTVADGAEALDFLFARGSHSNRNPNNIPKLVLLDLKLPKVDGLEVLRQIRENPNTRLVPVVVLTSSREEPDIVRCYELGVNSYLVKPVGFEPFVKAVGEAGLYWLLLNQAP